MHNFVVHSNESACRKSGFLGLDQVFNNSFIVPFFGCLFNWWHFTLSQFSMGFFHWWSFMLLNAFIQLNVCLFLIIVWCLTLWEGSTNVMLVNVSAITSVCYLQEMFYLTSVWCVTCWPFFLNVPPVNVLAVTSICYLRGSLSVISVWCWIVYSQLGVFFTYHCSTRYYLHFITADNTSI